MMHYSSSLVLEDGMNVVVIYLICILIICINHPKLAVFCNNLHFMKYFEPFPGYSGFVSIFDLGNNQFC